MIEDLQALKAVGVADVWKAGRLAAQRRRTPDGTTLRYGDDYDGPALSFSLPVDPGDRVFAGAPSHQHWPACFLKDDASLRCAGP